MKQCNLAESSRHLTSAPELVKFSHDYEKQFMKAILIGCLHQLFCELFKYEVELNTNLLLECYVMDSKIIQILINGIIETGEYTLEGISYHTRIPLDVIYDAASGINHQFSITPWARIADMYLQVKPEIAQVFIDRLLEIKSRNCAAVSLLLTDKL